MTEVVSVRFKNKGKVYYFDPTGMMIEKGTPVVVETSKGLEYAECTRGNHMVDDSAVVPPLRPIIRVATPEDNARAEENRKKEAEAFAVCNEKILRHGLDMKLIDVEYNFEGTKILFFFTSDGRVDFRDLVKDLASVFKTRIELRQIGVRDEARMLNGLGICGRAFCCAQFLDDFQPVSIKMAKTQGLSLNPAKISGTCGRLMCCLKYEQEAYEELVKAVPKMDSFVETPQGKGIVTDVNLLRRRVKVKLENQSDAALKTFDADEVKVIGGKAARAEYLAAMAEGNTGEEKRDLPGSKKRKTENAKKETLSCPGCTVAPISSNKTAEENEYDNVSAASKYSPEVINRIENESEPRAEQFQGENSESDSTKSKNKKKPYRKQKQFVHAAHAETQKKQHDESKSQNLVNTSKQKQGKKQEYSSADKQELSPEIIGSGEKQQHKKNFRYRKFRGNNKKSDITPKQ